MSEESAGFTFVELLVSLAVLLVLLIILLRTTTLVSDVWRNSTGRFEQFRGARNGFETMTRRLSQATLNTYWDYDNPTSPTKYIRQSELRFISTRDDLLKTALSSSGSAPGGSFALFCHAPMGVAGSASPSLSSLKALLNTVGYYVQFGNDSSYRPAFLNAIPTMQSPYRFRLIEMVEPAESLTVYQYTSYPDSDPAKFLVYPAPNAKPPTPYTGNDWFTLPLANKSFSRVLAQNIIALILLPKLSDQEDSTRARLSPGYSYNSAPFSTTATDPAVNPKNQLPPEIQVTMVALSESSAARIQKGSAQPGLGDLGYDIASLFQDATKFDADLKTLETGLQSKHLQYRTFTSSVSIVGAKWSRQQTN